MKKIQLSFILLFLIVSCRNSSISLDRIEQEKIFRISQFIVSEQGDASLFVGADSLFNVPYSNLKPNTIYIYVIDGSCSSCISDALDLYSIISKEGLISDEDFTFYSKSENNDLFKYYFNDYLASYANDGNGRSIQCLPIKERNELSNGLYKIKAGVVTDYLSWHY